MARRLIVGITGATGFTFGRNFVRYLLEEKSGVIEPHVILSEASKLVCKSELDVKLEYVGDFMSLFSRESKGEKDPDANFTVYANSNIGASIASGSFLTEGMVVLPCSMKTVSDIAYSRSENLITRAADVTLKESRKLILCVRETPLHKGHLENMLRCANMGAIIMPLMVSLYSGITTLEDLSDHFTGRILDQFGVHNNLTRRWKGE